MKAKIFTRLPIKQAWLDEVAALIPGITFEVVTTDKQMKVYTKQYINKVYGDFTSIREIIKDNTVQVRAFYMLYKELAALGITDHLALYDNSDRDGIFDFYVGLQNSLDARARKNGFKSNFAWEFIHEILHGYEQNIGKEYQAVNGDRTHDWESHGRLKALLAENLERGISLQKKQISLLQGIVEALKAMLALKNSKSQVPTLLHPVGKYKDLISQAYGVANPIYTQTKHHIGTDYTCPVGTPVLAPYDGEVTVAGNSPALGNFCHYKYTFDGVTYMARFMHLSAVPHKAKYKQGELIELSGKTGNVSGPHLHIDLFFNDVRVDLLTEKNFRSLTINPQTHYAIT
jgi:Peptidase family M23